jgi:RHS repeat-associated protein
MSFSSQISCNTLIIKIHSSCVGMRSISDYSGFGVQLDGRTSENEGYRFGFNGMEKDDELKGNGNSYDFGARMYDARVGRFLSRDPLQTEYPFYSPYQFAGLNPIKFIDLDGLEAYIKGTAGNELLNMMAQRSGLDLSLDANGLLTYATTAVVTDGVETTTPKIDNASSDFVSETFRNELIAVINGVDENGNKKSVVEYLAYTSQEIATAHGADNVFFDSYGTEAIFQNTQNYVDVTDLSNIQNIPELQTAILTHITSERGYGSYTFGHPKAMQN